MKSISLHPVSLVLGLGMAALVPLGSNSITRARAEQFQCYEYTSLTLTAPLSPVREVLGAWLGEHTEEYDLKKTAGMSEEDEASIPEALSRFGAHGWELVAVVRDERDDDYGYIFKRPLRQAAEK